YLMSKKKEKSKKENKHEEKDCPVHVEVEYNTVEVNIEGMSAGIDQASKNVIYENIMFKGEV
ncbi:MAG: hypothetical protein Q4E51_08700, partial [Lachnospiraceae bacterium]|nr:hypothetical protein [Lachnospiraceae bacterium]